MSTDQSTTSTPSTPTLTRIADRVDHLTDRGTGRLAGALAVKGVLSLLFGAVLIAWPSITVLAMMAIFATFAVVEGASNIRNGFTRADREGRWPMVLQGTVGVVVGILTFAWPEITALALLIMIGVWALAKGIGEMTLASHLRRADRSWGFVATAGVVSALFGLGVIVHPGAGAVAVVGLIAAVALVTGVACIAAAIAVERSTSAH